MIVLYESGINKIHTQEYAEAQIILGKLGDYKDSLEQIKTAERLEKQSRIYEEAMNLYTQGDFDEDSEELLLQCKTELAKLQQATTISAGIRSSVGMIKHGKVLLARDDYYSWRTELNTWNDIISVSVKGNFVVGLRENGTVVMAGKVPEFYVGTKTWDRIIFISAGQQYIVGLREDRTLVAQGLNSDNQADIDSWHDIVVIATGWRHTVGLNSEGKICITGFGSEEQLKDIEDNKDQWFDIVDIDAGGEVLKV